MNDNGLLGASVGIILIYLLLVFSGAGVKFEPEAQTQPEAKNE